MAYNQKRLKEKIILILIINVISLFHMTQQKNLVFLTEISRHGARTPMYEVLDGPKTWGKNFYPTCTLTGVGMRQHFLLGRQFRKIYVEESSLLSPNFNSTEIYVHTTSADRTQMSAQSQMYGLYFEAGQSMPYHWRFNPQTDLPPIEISEGKEILEEIGVENLPFSYQPIPSFGAPEREDDLILSPSESCDRIDEIQSEANDSVITQNFYKYLNKNGVISRFRELFTIPSNVDVTIRLIGKYFDTLVCNQFEQIPFPPNMTETDWEWIQFVYHFQQLYLDYSTEESKILLASNFLTDMMQNIDEALFENSGRKMQFYSASDGNLNILNLIFNVVSYTTDFDTWRLNQKKHSNTPFASTILLEIYQENDGSYSVVYQYNGEKYNICGEQQCSLENFKKICQKWILSSEQFDQQCVSQKEEYQQETEEELQF